MNYCYVEIFEKQFLNNLLCRFKKAEKLPIDSYSAYKNQHSNEYLLFTCANAFIQYSGLLILFGLSVLPVHRLMVL